MQPPKVKSVKRTKKVAAAPYVAKQVPKKETNPLIEKRPKNFGIGEARCKIIYKITSPPDVCLSWHCCCIHCRW